MTLDHPGYAVMVVNLGMTSNAPHYQTRRSTLEIVLSCLLHLSKLSFCLYVCILQCILVNLLCAHTVFAIFVLSHNTHSLISHAVTVTKTFLFFNIMKKLVQRRGVALSWKLNAAFALHLLLL